MPDKDMLINHVPGSECRIAIAADGQLEELYAERISADLHVGNIYRGRVTNVEPSIQAAFIDFGLERNGFLHITDVHPRYFPGEAEETTERVGHKTPRRDRPPIQQCLKRGQRVLVQVLKEGIGTKGPTLTSYLSIPGKFLVMMPNMERHGVSRKIDDPDKRREARKILDELQPPENFGFIVRTAGFDQPKTTLKRDLNYLLRLWKDIDKRAGKGRGPAALWTESDLMIRTLRDVLSNDIGRIIVDDRAAALRAKQFIQLATPRSSVKVIHYDRPMPIFDAFGIETQIQSINDREVPLPSGGSLIFDQAEAMVAIDVNSGKSRENRDAEQTAYKTNLEAVEAIARQLRLRDLGGLIVMDLIDMYQARHRRDVERKFRDCIKSDRARTKVLKISDLGLLEMTRQRMRPSLKKSVYATCAACNGTGHVLTTESTVLEATRRIAVALGTGRVARVELTARANVIAELLNCRRQALSELERRTGKSIVARVAEDGAPDALTLNGFDEGGSPVELSRAGAAEPPAFTDADEIAPEQLDELESLQGPADDEVGARAAAEHGDEEEEAAPKKKRRRRRRRRRGKKGDDENQPADESAAESTAETEPAGDTQPVADAEPAAEVEPAESEAAAEEPPAAGEESAERAEASADETPKRKRRRRRRRSKKNTDAAGQTDTPSPSPATTAAGGYEADHAATMPDEDALHQQPETNETPSKKKSTRRRQSGPKRQGSAEAGSNSAKKTSRRRRSSKRGGAKESEA